MPLLLQHRDRIIPALALGGIAVRDAVDHALRLLVPDLLVIFHHVAQVVAAAVVGFAHAHAVVCQVDIAVVAEEFGHFGGCGVCVELEGEGAGGGGGGGLLDQVFEKDKSAMSCEFVF